jgi:hypothetical protein
MVDADDPSTAPRRAELDRLAVANGGARLDHERIGYLIPARAIETWYVHLCLPESRPVDPGVDYKPSAAWRSLGDIAGAARAAVAAWHVDPRSDPSSLAEARIELQRLA